MRAGDFAGAWRIADRVLQGRAGQSRPDGPRRRRPVWDGSPLAGRRVLVRCHHEPGDTIQFIRFVRPLQAIARRVVTCVQPALIPLLRTMPGHGRLLPLHDAPDVDYDVDIELMELPHYFRATVETLPGTIPYLLPPRAELGRRHPARPAVGLVWHAGDGETERSIPAPALAPLTRAGAELFLLQRGRALADWPFPGAVDAGSDDPLALASTMRALDLVITVDCFPAHLAGALGVPVWTLLGHRADWRWMDDRPDSPWYPTMRLFRQHHPGDWTPLIEEVAAGIALRARHSSTAYATPAFSRR